MPEIKLRFLTYMLAATLATTQFPFLAVAQQGNAPAAPRRATQTRVVVAPSAPQDVVIENGVFQTPDMNFTVAPMPPMPPMPPMGFEPMTFNFIANEMSFNGKVVKGAPYSAEAVNETIQTFADGNRIVRKSTSNIYRDSEGRTRREQDATPFRVGQYFTSNTPATEAGRTIFINDPVTGINYVLDSKARTARKLPNLNFRISKEVDKALGEAQKNLKLHGEALQNAERAQALADRIQGITSSKENREVEARVAPNGERRVTIVTSKDGQTRREELTGEAAEKALKDLRERHGIKGVDENTKTENLGKQSFDGVEAEGTRTTRTIPAGEIGNERPLEIVSERWYAPALQAVVMTRRSDPRSGETTYRLTNINRGEPSRSLFEVPADYTVKESPAMPFGNVRVERRLKKDIKEENKQ
ncbi:MAG: hypothetical protein MSG64_02225 [Pyrinomonadaceae bacterium MAG19_C2-C3]|nr:hypothetical protein [Pyrinomonadaceae bacterium MAG19_C2-C3]